jgi:hypothetical protein
MNHLLKNKNTISEPLTICISLVLFMLFQFNQDYFQLKFWFFYGAQLHVPFAYFLSYPSIIILTFFIYKKSKIAWWIIVSMGTYFILHFGWNYIKELKLPEFDQHENSLGTLLTLFEEPRFGLFYYLSNMLVCFVPIYFCIRFKAHFSITRKILWSSIILSIVLFTLDVLFIKHGQSKIAFGKYALPIFGIFTLCFCNVGQQNQLNKQLLNCFHR